MPKINPDMIAFNRGIVSPLALARVDVARTRLSAETMTNWLPKTQGAMRLRPGTAWLGSSRGDAAAAWLEFVASTDDTALIEITDGKVRVWANDAPITRPAVTTTISNGAFASSSGWSDGSSDGGALSFGGAGLTLNATCIGGLARCTRNVAVAVDDRGTEHALAIEVTRGPVVFRCGSSSGGDDYVSETTLRSGRHSLAFTPTGSFHLTFQSVETIDRIVKSIAVEAAGTMEIDAPWGTDDLDNIRFDQSADVLFVAASGYRQRRIERRGAGRSWSVVVYHADNGPFLTGRSSGARLKVGATHGNTTLVSDLAFFSSAHVGALIRGFHSGQSGSYAIGRDGAWSDVWQVTGIGATTERRAVVVTSGTWSGNLRVQRSYDGPDSGFRTFVTITTNTTTNIDDSDDNLEAWYRIGFADGDHSSGVVTAAVTYTGGGRTGVARVTGYTSPTSVDVEVLSRFSSTDYTEDWQEGWWSDAQSWPSAVSLHEGRLWWFGGTQVFGSVADDFHNYDDATEGDAGPIVRSIGRGPVDRVYFALPLGRQIIGTAGAEISLRSSSLDRPLTPEDNSARPVSTQGAANVRAVAVDARGVFVQRSGRRVFLLTYDFTAGDYLSRELTLLVPDLLDRDVVAIGVQRQPDTRVHCVLGDGKVAILTFEAEEEVLAWSMYETAGAVEKVAVLPGTNEDEVYYHVRRTINGATVRMLEKWTAENACHFPSTIHDGASTGTIGDLPYADGTRVTVRDAGGAKLENLAVSGAAIALSEAASYAHVTPSLCRLADCQVIYDGAATTTISGLDHLEGCDVVVWADGKDRSPDDGDGVQTTYTVTEGAITLDEAVETAVVGLAYEAAYRSTKLAYGSAAGTALAQMKRVDHLALVLASTHNAGLAFGSDPDHLDALPRGIAYLGRPLDAVSDATVFDRFDQVSMAFPGVWDADARLHLRARAPRPVTVMAAIPSMQTRDKR